MFTDQSWISLFSELLRVGRFVADQFEPRDPASFLVNGNDRLDLRQIAKIIYQPTKLPRRLDVPSEENIPSGLDSPEEEGRFGIKLDSGHTNKQELT
jgi:hypothetical protein